MDRLPVEIIRFIIDLTLPDENSRSTLDRSKILLSLSLVNSIFRYQSQILLFQHVRWRTSVSEAHFFDLLDSGVLKNVNSLIRSIYYADFGSKNTLKSVLTKLKSVSEVCVYWPSEILELNDLSIASNLRTLHLISTSGIREFTDLETLPIVFNNLEHLSIINPLKEDLFLLLDSASSFPHLTSLVIILAEPISFKSTPYTASNNSVCKHLLHLTVGIHGAGGDGLEILGSSHNRLLTLGKIVTDCVRLESLSVLSPGGSPLVFNSVQLRMPFPSTLIEFSFICSSFSTPQGIIRGGKQLEILLQDRLKELSKVKILRFHFSWLERVKGVVGNLEHLRLLPNDLDTDYYLDYYTRLRRGYC